MNIDENEVYDTCHRALYNHSQLMRYAIHKGLNSGVEVYGELDIDTDRRDFLAEAGQELRDAMIYIACEIIKRQRSKPQYQSLYLDTLLASIATTWGLIGGKT